MADETMRCPYCREEILAVAQKCKHCGEWLNSESPDILENKDPLQVEFKQPTFVTLLLTMVTFGIYPFIWICRRYKKLNNLIPQKQLSTGLVVATGISLLLAVIWCIIVAISAFCFNNTNLSSSSIFNTVAGILMIVISFKMLGQLKAYAKVKYQKDIKYNWLWAILFSIFYVNFSIQSFDKKLSKV